MLNVDQIAITNIEYIHIVKEPILTFYEEKKV